MSLAILFPLRLPIKQNKSIPLAIEDVWVQSDCILYLRGVFIDLLSGPHPPITNTRHLMVRQALFGRDRLLATLAEEARMLHTVTKADLAAYSDFYRKKTIQDEET
jgi:hypothetical protein